MLLAAELMDHVDEGELESLSRRADRPCGPQGQSDGAPRARFGARAHGAGTVAPDRCAAGEVGGANLRPGARRAQPGRPGVRACPALRPVCDRGGSPRRPRRRRGLAADPRGRRGSIGGANAGAGTGARSGVASPQVTARRVNSSVLNPRRICDPGSFSHRRSLQCMTSIAPRWNTDRRWPGSKPSGSTSKANGPPKPAPSSTRPRNTSWPANCSACPARRSSTSSSAA